MSDFYRLKGCHTTNLVPKIWALPAPPSILPAYGCPAGMTLGGTMGFSYVEVFRVVEEEVIDPVFGDLAAEGEPVEPLSHHLPYA